MDERPKCKNQNCTTVRKNKEENVFMTLEWKRNSQLTHTIDLKDKTFARREPQ